MNKEPKPKTAAKKTKPQAEVGPKQVTIAEDAVLRIVECAARMVAEMDDVFPGRIVRIKAVQAPNHGGLTEREKNFLRGIRDAQALGNQTPSFIMSAILAGMSDGGTFWKLRANMRKQGWIEYVGKTALTLTSKGKKMFPLPKTPLTHEEYLERVKQCVTKKRFPVVKVLVEFSSGEWITRDELAKKSEFSRGSDKFTSILTYLRKLELLEYGPNQTCRASARLMMTEIV